ncbi:transcriptional activator srcap [Fusarium tjaetaba]|uniref:Transcriptional activator srcap n=1 Tax=Fusarium tjaetaba TaxID=1567544 RepID=A0A8H5S6R2_9HYPO|nr:transcriptional activator srcap [Fusarium tjaetaba]KAF5644976.1 transcriptional activator srcap [Fusarium tjaetaba]
MPTYRVDTFQIALGVVGDSAIHLLIKEPSEVVWAMLVDGGDSGGEEKIRDTMAWIEQSTKYNIYQKTQPRLQFDAVVITHWDKDHWTGVLNLMKQAYEKQPLERKLPFFKYDEETMGDASPLTIIYCPEEGFLSKSTLRFDPKPPNANPVDVNFRFGKNEILRACRLRMEPKKVPTQGPVSTLLGTNLITGKDIEPISNVQNINSPRALLLANPPDQRQPGIYIIGVSTRVFGPLPPNNLAEESRGPILLDKGVGFVDENKPGTPTNKSSIACMIMWDTAPSPRLSHYFAGDMHWQEEKSLVEWTKASGDRNRIGKYVSSLKLSHHGAKSSTPTMMLEKFNPHNLIASVGERNGHPSWEFLFYVQGWMAAEGPQKAAYPPVLTTQFPYYLARWRDPNNNSNEDWIPLPGGSSNQMSMRILDGSDKSASANGYRAAVVAIFDRAGTAVIDRTGLVLSDPFADWDTAKANDQTLDAKAWARTRIADSWSRLSPVQADMHPGVGVIRSNDNFKLTRRQNMMLFYIIESVNDSKRDGGVLMVHGGLANQPKRLRPDPNLVPPTAPITVNLSFPKSPALGVQTNISFFNVPAKPNRHRKAIDSEGMSEFGRLYKRKKSPKDLEAPGMSAPVYSPASGTNPNENDDLLDFAATARNLSDNIGGDTDSMEFDGGSPPVIGPLPVPGIPGPPPGKGLKDLEAPFFFICSSDLKYNGPPPNTVKQLTSAHPLNEFVSTFHLKGIILARQPDPSQTDQVSLHDQDQFLGWLRTALVPPGQQTLSIPHALDGSPNIGFTAFTNPQIADYFTDFALTIPMLGGSMNYSSQATAAQLNLPTTLFGPGSTVPWENSLILGLESPESYQNLTLAMILKPATDRGATLGLLNILKLLLGDDTFHVDTSTTAATRNAIWFEPMSAYNTVVRTQYAADAGLLAALNSWIKLTDFSIDTFTLITKLRSSWIPTSEALAALNRWEVLIHSTCTIRDPNGDTIASPMVLFDFQSQSLTITLQFDTPPDMDGILKWVLLQVSDAHFDFQHWFSQATTKNFSTPVFRRLVLVVDLDEQGGFPTRLDGLSIDLEVGVLFGKTEGQEEDVVFLFTYDWSQQNGSSLQGTLWCPPPDDPIVDRRLLPGYEPCKQFEPATVTPTAPWAGSLDLANLIPNGSDNAKIINIPDGIPSEVIMVELAIDKDGISFQAKLECKEPVQNNSGGFPTIFLSRISLNASYAFTKQFSVGFGFGITMFPQEGSTVLPIELTGAVNYNSGSWSASAAVETPSMQGAHLLSYFDSDTKDDAAALIQHIQLLYLSLDYQYSNGVGSSFQFTGSMGIGELELDLNFNYTSGQPWTFTATVDTFPGSTSTLQHILDSIVGDATVNLPSCVADIKVGDTSGVAEPLFKLTLQGLKTNSGTKDGKGVISKLEVNIGVVSFTFLQYRNSSWDINNNASKRVLRLEVHNLPDFDIPVLGTIPLSETIEEICFMWVQDGSNTNVEGQKPGLTKKEIETLNEEAFTTAPLYYKATREKYADTDVLIEAGCHFVIVTKDAKGSINVVMDYVFLKPSSDDHVPPPSAALFLHAAAKRRYGSSAIIHSKIKGEVDALADANAGSGTQKTSFKVSLGPLDISNVGIRFSNSVFSLCFDASIAVGPTAMALQGFSIDFDFGNGHDLQHNFPVPGFSLQGFIISFDRPPLAVGGGLIRVPTANKGDTYWAGGVDIEFRAWSFLAAGAYGSLTVDGETFTTTFVFAQLQGPLINMSYASINDLTGGFGYNNNLTLPAIADVPAFPFLALPKPPKPSPTGNSTMDMLTALLKGQWFSPRNGSFWIAAGFTVTALQMLQVTAVATIQCDPEVKAGIYAVAIADIPSTKAKFKLAHIELGIAATVDLAKGIAAFEAQLAPSSFILDPACHLTGGFALYYWFTGTSGQQAGKPGDWVFTLGGYHAAYKPPSQYPNPPRLQIQWSLGPLSITGQAYFAITPVACMAGGCLHASLNIGVLSAWLDAYADFIINYSPFSFKAAGGLSVGVRYTLDLLFVTLHINIEISAMLTLMGPPFHGSIYVDFWVFGFTVNFGTQEPPVIAKATLEEFYYLALQKDSPTAQTTPPTPHKFNCLSGLIPSPPPDEAKKARWRKRLGTLGAYGKARLREEDEDEIHSQEKAVGDSEGDDDSDELPPVWEVHAGTFTFSISSVFAVSDVTLNATDADPVDFSAPQPQTTDIYSRPMYLTTTDKPLKSELVVTIAATTPKTQLQLQDGPNPWVIRPLIDQMPRALWDSYDPNTDPNNGSKALLNNPGNPTVPLMMSVLLIPPEPRLSKDLIQSFDAVASLPQDVLANPPDFPPYADTANTAWLPIPPTEPPLPDPALPWENVKAAWETPELGVGAASVMSTAWNECMGWGVQPPSLASTRCSKAKTQSSPLVSGAVPKRLVAELEALYVAAPMMGVAQTV